ncbi:hypothetical protein METHB2_310043 [Candidatus Methylobacter favarea]|uniref:Uncharacterized protein n=1 Tax=Candidatus Methylobacter favarea TaxID=2707345 RepID=A0A8S0XSR7_9GAMM|nr:hypothetical protein METHB2_310043 [Candidatus Methylobacter favarea]
MLPKAACNPVLFDTPFASDHFPRKPAIKNIMPFNPKQQKQFVILIASCNKINSVSLAISWSTEIII